MMSIVNNIKSKQRLLILIFASFGLCQLANAKIHSFRFNTEDLGFGVKKQWQVKINSDDPRAAYRQAAFDCARDLKRGQRLTDDTILGIVNTCANPKQ